MGQKAITIQTPDSEAPHITAEDDAFIYSSLIGVENGILGDLTCVKVDDTTIELSGGGALNRGHALRIPDGDTLTLSVDSGTTSYKRYDSVVAEFVRGGGTTADSYTIKIIKGTSSTSSPTAPQLTTSDLTNQDDVNQVELFRLYLNGTMLSNITQTIDRVQDANAEQLTDYVYKKITQNNYQQSRAVRYGIKINKLESDPASRITYLYDAEGMTPAHMDFDTGTFDYGDWENVFFVKGNRPVMLNSDRTVAYEMDANDYSLLAASGLQGTTSSSITISRQPSNVLADSGASVTFSIAATGDGLTYQWQLSDDKGKTWRNSSVKTAEYATTLSSKNDGRYVRCVITDSSDNTATTNAAVMLIKTEVNAMSEFPLIWLCQYEVDNYEYIIVSNKQIDETYRADAYTREDGTIAKYMYLPIYGGSYDGNRLRSLSGETLESLKSMSMEINRAAANGNGWTIIPWCRHNLINCLLLILGKSENVRAVFGYGHLAVSGYGDPTGYVDDSTQNYGMLNTGTLDTKGQFYGAKTYTEQVKVFHMEKAWGDRYEYVAGYIEDNRRVKVKMSPPYNVTGNGYIDTGIDAPTANGYQKDSYMTRHGRFPRTTTGASATTYLCAFHYADLSYGTLLVPRFGGDNTGHYHAFMDCFLAANNAVSYTTGASISCESAIDAEIDEMYAGAKDTEAREELEEMKNDYQIATMAEFQAAIDEVI